MKKIFFVGVLAVASLSFAATTSEATVDEAVKCTMSLNTSSTTNPDGSTTQTTTTSVSCDTAQELAAFHAGMKAFGMGV